MNFIKNVGLHIIADFHYIPIMIGFIGTTQ